MRPIRLAYAPITADADHFNAAVTSTGAAIVPTNTATTDGLAHFVTLTSGVGADLSGLSFALVGTDADGKDQTETIAAGPNGSTVSGSKYFKTLASVTPSATMATVEMTIGIGAASLTPSIPLDRRSIAAAAITVEITGTINFTGQDTIGDVFAIQPSTLPWSTITALSAKTATTDGSARVGATATRVLTNSVTNGATLVLWISQASQTTG
jgi:hypothetical protein